MNISSIQASELPQALLTQQTIAAPSGTDSQGSFSSMVSDLLEATNLEQTQVGTEVEQLLTGESSNLHDVSIAVARADISFRFMMEIRDQLVGAYREVMRMQI